MIHRSKFTGINQESKPNTKIDCAYKDRLKFLDV